MTVLFARRALMLSGAPVQSSAFNLDPLTETVTVRIQTPTTLVPRAWLATDRLQVSIILTLDGQEHRSVGTVSGGIRASGSRERTEYVLRYTPTWGFFGARSGPTKRLGELRQSTYTASILIESLSGGAVSTEIEASSTEAAAPLRAFHSSVAFDTATDTQESGGDGVISLTHTASGSDRAAFAGATNIRFSGFSTSTSTTYAGNTMTEMWNTATASVMAHAGYRLAGSGVSTGAQTVTNTLATAPDDHILGVITMTGVDGTTPVGTAATNSGSATPATVTVGSVGTDDLVVDNAAVPWSGTITVGADQTSRYTEDAVNGLKARGSTQLGSLGGVMSWTLGGADPFGEGWLIGAVAFKPSASAATAYNLLIARYP